MVKKVILPIEIVSLGDEGSHIFCKAKVNGKKARVLIDTGASKTVLSQEFADSLKNLRPVDIDDNTTSGIGPDKVDAQFAKIKKLEFKGLTVKKLIVGTIDVSHVVAMYHSLGLKPFDMLLGGDVLEMHQAKIDYRKKQLTLYL